MVAKGFIKIKGIDYLENFSPAGKMTTICFMLTLATPNNWFQYQLDVNTAFLYGDLDEEVYMMLPLGLDAPSKNTVCKLSCFIYGLKQANRTLN